MLFRWHHHHHHQQQQQRYLSGNNRNRAQKLTLILIVIGFLLATSKLSSRSSSPSPYAVGCGNWRTHCRPEDWVGEALAILCYHPSNLSVCPGDEYENLISWPGALPISKAANVWLGFSPVKKTKKKTVNYLVGYLYCVHHAWLSNSHHSRALMVPEELLIRFLGPRLSFYLRQPLKTADRES